MLATVLRGREKLYLVRLQNPWGEKEWTGPFGDKYGPFERHLLLALNCSLIVP